MKLKHYAILCAPILITVATHLKGVSQWSDVLVPQNVGELLLQVASVVTAMVMRSPKDDAHLDAVIEANDDLRRRQGSFIGGGAA